MAENEEEDQGPPPPVIFEKCFKVDGMLYYGECKIKESDEDPPPEGEELPKEYLRHGRGTTYYLKKTLNGDERVWMKHEGMWDMDSMSGYGKVTYYNGNHYAGELNDGVFDGEGNFTWQDGSYFRGNWSQNQMHGSGLFQSDFTGKYCEGDFHRNCVMNNFKWRDVLMEVRKAETQAILFDKIDEKSNAHMKKEFPIVNCFDPSKLQPLITKYIEDDNLVPLIIVDSSFGSEGNFSPMEWIEVAAMEKIDRVRQRKAENKQKALDDLEKQMADELAKVKEEAAAGIEDETEAAAASEVAALSEERVEEFNAKREEIMGACRYNPDILGCHEDVTKSFPSRTLYINHLAKVKRRRYDYHALLRKGIQESLLANDKLLLIYPAYDEVTAPEDNNIPLEPQMKLRGQNDPPDGDDDVAIAPPNASIMGRALELEKKSAQVHIHREAPAEWRLSHFYDDYSFPVRLFNPSSFMMDQTQLRELITDVEATRKDGVGEVGKASLIWQEREKLKAAEAAASGGDAEAENAGGDAEGENTNEGTNDLDEHGNSVIVGLDLNGQKIDKRTLYGLEFCIVVEQPVVVHAAETKLLDIRQQLVERFGNHIPLHRTGVICCGQDYGE